MKKNGVKSLSSGIQQSDIPGNIDELLAEALVKEGEQPYKAPKNWIWVKLDNLCKKIVDGTHETPQYTETGVPFISVKDIRHRKINFEDCKYISEADHNLLKKRCNPEKNDVLLTKSGTIGRTAVVNFNLEFSLFVSVALLKPFSTILNSAFLAYGLESYINSIDVNQSIKGAVIKNFHISDLKKLEFPLSPLKEQLHIVEKLDTMLEKIGKARELIREARESFKIRRTTILHKAFTGELTKKWREENKDIEPASELLEKMERKEKLKGNFESKIETEMILKNEDIPYKTPNTWVWTKLVNFAQDAQYSFVDGPFGSNLKTSDYVEHGIRLIQLQNIGDGFWNDENKKYTSEKKANELLRCKVNPGDIVVAKMASPIARATIVPAIEKEYIIVADCIKITLAAYVSTQYANFCINSPNFRNIAEKFSKGTTRKRINLKDLKSIPVPLPPLEEQKEIVRILNSLMRSEEEAKELIDLENCLDSLEKSILFKAFRGKLGTNNPQDEPAIELLRRILLEKEALRIEPKQLKKRGGDSMDKKGQVKKTEANLGLIEILKESNEWMKPETLFEKAGYTHETIEEFYGELKRFVENNEIYEKRQNDSDVFLGINDHENRKTVDKRI